MRRPITIDRIELSGFRAYLCPQTFNFRLGKNPLSMAVFAPNGTGKSSLAYSFEYYIAKDLTLKRFGKKASARGGTAAMEHVDAKKKGITPKVHFWFSQGSEKFDDSRQVPGPPPEAARRVLQHIGVEPVIRGHDLRWFTESASPGERYVDLARWFSLDPLLDIQKNCGLCAEK